MKSLVPNDQTRRRCLVGTYFLSILAVVTLFGVLTIPDIAKEGADFVNRLQSDNIWVILVEKTRRGLGCVSFQPRHAPRMACACL